MAPQRYPWRYAAMLLPATPWRRPTCALYPLLVAGTYHCCLRARTSSRLTAPCPFYRAFSTYLPHIRLPFVPGTNLPSSPATTFPKHLRGRPYTYLPCFAPGLYVFAPRRHALTPAYPAQVGGFNAHFVQTTLNVLLQHLFRERRHYSGVLPLPALLP